MGEGKKGVSGEGSCGGGEGGRREVNQNISLLSSERFPGSRPHRARSSLGLCQPGPAWPTAPLQDLQVGTIRSVAGMRSHCSGEATARHSLAGPCPGVEVCLLSSLTVPRPPISAHPTHRELPKQSNEFDETKLCKRTRLSRMGWLHESHIHKQALKGKVKAGCVCMGTDWTDSLHSELHGGPCIPLVIPQLQSNGTVTPLCSLPHPFPTRKRKSVK